MQSTTVTVVIPVYNEYTALAETVRQFARAVSQDPDLSAWEIIVVDDGSSDGCGEVAHSLRTHLKDNLQWHRHDSNRGYGAALKTGIRHAKYDLILIADADGTYPAERVSDLLKCMATADMVVGSRTGKDVQYPWTRKLPKAILKSFAEWIAGQRIPDLNSGLRVFRRSDLAPFEQLLPNGFSFTTTITLAMLTRGRKVHFEPISYARRLGKSKFRPFRDTWLFCTTILRLGVFFAPLRIFLPVAIALFIAGTVTLTGDVFIRQDITDRTVILFLAALQIGMFALLADIISRK